MDLAYLQGTEVHKYATETTVLTGTKYSETQLLDLMVFCGLGLTEGNLLYVI